MASDAEIRRIVLFYNQRNEAIRQRVLDFMRTQWGALEEIRPIDIERFVRVIEPMIEAGKLQVASLTDSYLAVLESTITEQTVRPVGVPRDITKEEFLRGVPTAEVYKRAGPTVWTSLSEGNDFQSSMRKTITRLAVAAAIDLQLAHTHAARYVTSRKDNVSGTRRVLVGTTSCRLCVTAAGKEYKKTDLIPIHGRCDCKVIPIFGREDPGKNLNENLVAEGKGDEGIIRSRQLALDTHRKLEDELLQTQDKLRETTDSDKRSNLISRVTLLESRRKDAAKKIDRYQNQLDDYHSINPEPKTVTVETHGEIGPVLVDSDHAFYSP